MKIRFNIDGRILRGDNEGGIVNVLDDRAETGGYLILEFDSDKKNECFDTWIADDKSLYDYFKTSKWSIKWLDTAEVVNF